MSNNTDLMDLKREMDRALAGARTGAVLVVLVSIVSIAIIGYWLNYAHQRLTEVTPEFAVNAGVAKFQEALPTLVPQLSRQAIDAAPKVMDDVEARLMAIPDDFADMLVRRSGEELDRVLPEVEKELLASLRAALDKAAADRAPGVTDEAQVKAVVEVLVDTYAEETRNLVQELRQRYTATGGDVLAYLEFLADNRGLNREQMLQRQALVTFLTIASRARGG
ncbi:MAG: hypothetical protein ACK4PI_00035 [Tepidisphaerales bacterium]